MMGKAIDEFKKRIDATPDFVRDNPEGASNEMLQVLVLRELIEAYEGGTAGSAPMGDMFGGIFDGMKGKK
jgi:hypothetical protein